MTVEGDGHVRPAVKPALESHGHKLILLPTSAPSSGHSKADGNDNRKGTDDSVNKNFLTGKFLSPRARNSRGGREIRRWWRNKNRDVVNAEEDFTINKVHNVP